MEIEVKATISGEDVEYDDELHLDAIEDIVECNIRSRAFMSGSSDVNPIYRQIVLLEFIKNNDNHTYVYVSNFEELAILQVAMERAGIRVNDMTKDGSTGAGLCDNASTQVYEKNNSVQAVNF